MLLREELGNIVDEGLLQPGAPLRKHRRGRGGGRGDARIKLGEARLHHLRRVAAKALDQPALCDRRAPFSQRRLRVLIR